MLGLLLLTECGSCKKDVAATHPVSQDPACDQTGGHHQRRHHILLMSGFPMLQIRHHHIAVQFRPNQHYHQHHDLDLNTSQRNWCMNGLAPSSAKKDAVYFVQNIKINHYFGWKSGLPRSLCSWSMNNKAWTNQSFTSLSTSDLP